MSENGDTRMRRLGYRPPLDEADPEQLVLEDYVSGGRVAIITFNRPHADNAITTELARQLIEILETVAARPSVRVAVITSAGDRAFSVGGDLYERKQMTKEEWLRQRQVFDRVLYTLRQLRRPIIARRPRDGIRRRLRDSDQHRLHHRVRRRRLRSTRGDGGSVGRRRLSGLLPRLLPPGKAMQMLMTGDPITAQEAFRLGMVNEVHPRAGLMDAVCGIAAKIADNSPTAVQSVKRAVKMGQGQSVEQAIEIMMDEHWRSVVHPDRVEGILAYTEGREPDFPDPEF